MKPLERKIILASKSPRRSQLLRDAGFYFEVLTKEVDESFPADIPVSQVAEYLARRKAQACREFLTDDSDILLTADSTVVVADKIYNKPADFAEAVSMLSALSGKTHVVYTGVCMLSGQREISFTGVSKVTFEPLSLAEINYYVEHYKPYDKAGSYAVQEWIGLCKISKIEGTYSNIMGLPVDLVYSALADWPD
jgi:septum formation protein